MESHHYDVSLEGVLDSLAAEELLKRAWAVVDSFRHVQHQVVHGVMEWLPTVPVFLTVKFQQRAAARALEHCAYPRAAVDQLVAGGAALRGWPSSCASRLEGRCFLTTLLSLRQMAWWTTSRWLSLARTCRRYLASRVIGLHSIVAFVRARPQDR